MILLNSPMHRNLKEALNDVESTNSELQWQATLKKPSNNAMLDGFLAVLDHGVEKKLFSEVFASVEFDKWLLHADQWRNQMSMPGSPQTAGNLVLYLAWDHFAKSLGASLRQGRLNANLPKSGGILAFLAGLSKCLILNYEIIGEVPKLRPIAIVLRPKSAFDFWGAIDQADVAARNALKGILATGHKIIAHRGIVVHVDRRNDTNVFGPSIDTLILSELLSQQVLESSDFRPKVAAEIGTGNGMLSSLLFTHGISIQELYCVDINFNAVSCTARNIMGQTFNQRTVPGLYLISGAFRPDLINRKFDLIVSNPPYIPTAPELGFNESRVANFHKAVAGTDLLHDLIRNADAMLNPGGRMLLMTSSLSFAEVLSWIPSTVRTSFPLEGNGYEVVFDVESVLNTPDWLSFLVDKKGLLSREGLYYHNLHPIWISKPE